MTNYEALRMALEALEWNLPVIEDYGVPNQLKMQHKAITSIYEALAQPEDPCKGANYSQTSEQEPVCDKCHGLGYYDEGHECDDGTMAGGNYVECEKCKQP